MNVTEIVADWLKQHGYDGLCGENCGCYVDDLFICGIESCGVSECEPGYKQIITDPESDAFGLEGIAPNKPEEQP